MDPNALVRKWLATGLSTERVSVAVLPEYDEQQETGFRPEDGPWIVIGIDSGGFISGLPVFQGTFQITVYAGVDEGLAAGSLSVQIRDLIHDKNHIDLSPDGYVLACTENSDGQPGTESVVGLATSTSRYDMILRSN